MGQAFYRKYRPKLLADVVGQEHITTTLSRALAAGNISHAYLLSGPRGVGKTSIARILAHEVNGIPYSDESMHLDIIEIDAASNRGIEEIRDLKEKIHNAPTSSRYKIYIIDEVHMLTTPAFNALLKTLEEPPAHVIFILATTEAHKLPETIISRTQRFTFRPIDNNSIVKHLKTIAKKEKIDISPEAFELIAQHGQGSFRDSLSLLDQAGSSAESITADVINQLLGVPPSEIVQKLLTSTISSTADQLIQTLKIVQESGYRATSIATQLTRQLRQQLLDNKLTVPANLVLELLRQLLAVPAAQDPALLLEITLIGFNLHLNPLETIPQTIPAAAQPPRQKVNTDEVNPEPDKIKTVTPPSNKIKKTTLSLDEHWPQVLSVIKTKYNTLYSILRMAKPRLDNDGLILLFTFAFHQKKINEDKSRQIIQDVLAQVTGSSINVRTIVDKTARPFTVTTDATIIPSNIELDTISNIFGGAEVLE